MKRPDNAPRLLVSVLALAMTVGAAWLALELAAEANDYDMLPASVRPAIVALRWASLAAAAAAVAIVLSRRRALGDLAGRPIGAPLRACVYWGLLAIAVASLTRLAMEPEVIRHALRSVLFSSLLLAESAWLASLALAPRALFRPPRGIVAGLDVVLLNGTLSLLLVEVVLTVWATVSPSPLISREVDARSIVAAHKMKPGEPFFGFPANSGGFHDAEFFRAEGDDFVVALVADSFGVGVVPHAFNFATVAERILAERLRAEGRRVAIHDFGVSAIGMTGYAWLLEHEVPEVAPRWVVLAIFVGNDLSGFRHTKTRYHTFQDWQTFRLAGRLLALQRESAAGGRVAEIGARDPQVPDWIHDPELERPSFSEERFLAIELERMERCDPQDPRMRRYYAEFFDALDVIQERIGDRLVVLLIPDEYQVNDDLYRQLLAIAPATRSYQRDLPQREVMAHCERRALRCLDLLEPLRSAQAQGRVYHRRDTHWNARGNRVAGEALADYITSLAEESSERIR